MNKVLIISVHPDDETLGCGGTILKHRAAGDLIYWLILTHVNDAEIWSEAFIARREAEIRQVGDRYGFQEILNLKYDTTQLDRVPISDPILKISGVLKQYGPDIIYFNNRSDIHSDHQIAFKAVMSAAKSFNQPSIKRLLMYETISETDFAPALQENAFVPNYFVDISPYIDEKIKIMEIFSSELKPHPFPRSEQNIRALATYRGAQCGVGYAESFMILKDIWK